MAPLTRDPRTINMTTAVAAQSQLGAGANAEHEPGQAAAGAPGGEVPGGGDDKKKGGGGGAKAGTKRAHEELESVRSRCILAARELF